MSEQAPNLTPDVIPPAPEGEYQIPATPEQPDGLIEVPDFMKPTVAPEAPVAEVDAARRLIDAGDIPGYTAPTPVPQVEFQAPSREPIEVPMPADPSKVPGWEGIVRRP